MRKLALLMVCSAALAVGCVNVKAPERINVGGGPPPEDVDSSRVPNPQTLEEARMELNKAYRQIQYLENENRSLEHDKRKYKEERDEYKKKYKNDHDD